MFSLNFNNLSHNIRKLVVNNTRFYHSDFQIIDNHQLSPTNSLIIKKINEIENLDKHEVELLIWMIKDLDEVKSTHKKR